MPVSHDASHPDDLLGEERHALVQGLGGIDMLCPHCGVGVEASVEGDVMPDPTCSKASLAASSRIDAASSRRSSQHSDAASPARQVTMPGWALKACSCISMSSLTRPCWRRTKRSCPPYTWAASVGCESCPIRNA